MKHIIRPAAIVSILVALQAPVHAAETLESAEKKIIAAANKVRGISAKTSTHMEMQTDAMKTSTTATGTFEYVRRGKKAAYRLETRTVTTLEFASNETKIEQTTVTICDGDTVLTLSERDGQTTGIKTKADSVEVGFSGLRKGNLLKLLPDAKVDGSPAYVVEATPKGKGNGVAKIVSYFLKSSGFNVKTVTYGLDGKPLVTREFTDLKFNPRLSADRFVIEVPAGVEVQDLTGR